LVEFYAHLRQTWVTADHRPLRRTRTSPLRT